jgi:hypothetical protein
VGDDRFGPAGEEGKDEPKDNEDITEVHGERERQARDTLRRIRETRGELGARVRLAMRRASELWAQASPVAEDGQPDPSMAGPADEQRARALARRWIEVDFLVDPDLPDIMGVTAVSDDALWRVDLVERGETRYLTDSSEPYRGAPPSAPGPILPAWDYTFPATPQIEAGERRERLPDTDLLIACAKCNGTGHSACPECEGTGFLQCPKCHGRARIICRHCRGRGVIADSAAERRARASKPYLQIHAERLANDTAWRLADFAERLRQEHGVPLPPSAQWMPVAPASGVTQPCPDCVDGLVPCDCRSGKVICAVCLGGGQTECKSCGATGRIIRHRELVRRFDTLMTERIVPPDRPVLAEWLREHSPRRVAGETAWQGSANSVASQPAPQEVPAPVWAVAQELASEHARMLPGQSADERGERRVFSREIRLLRVPFLRVEYTIGGQRLEFVAVGARGSERFWAHTFPTRLTRLGRFLRAIMRDLAAERAEHPERPVRPNGEISTLAEYRERRLRQQPYSVRIAEEEPGDSGKHGGEADAGGQDDDPPEEPLAHSPVTEDVD